MTVPRFEQINEDEVGVYLLTNRCVRRAYLLGNDYKNGDLLDYRRDWVVKWLESLASVMMIDILAFAVMDNHAHEVVRNRPDLVQQLSDEEAAERLARLYPGFRCSEKLPEIADPKIKQRFLDSPNLGKLKRRLSSISVFMAKWQEAISHRANRYEGCTGRFWEGRFHCTKLLDSLAVFAASVYVDLNPIRAGMVRKPEDAKHTSFAERVSFLQKSAAHPWLAPISNCDGRGFLDISDQEYLDLAEQMARKKRRGKRSRVSDDIPPFVTRLGLAPTRWCDAVFEYVSKFKLRAGSPALLIEDASRRGKQWTHGISAARMFYES